ncbi:hypothetical protein DMI62_01345 [Escherichia coli]|nr:hypothetical protein [Escherichia coli]
MSSSRPVFARAGCLICWSRSSSSPLSFIWLCGRSVVVLATKRRSGLAFSSQFVGSDNFVTLFHDSYLDAFWTTIKFSTFVTVSGLLVSLFFAALVEYIVRGSRFYQTLMLLPYAVVPAVAAVLWIFLFNPGRGLITHFSLSSATTGTTRKTAVRRCSRWCLQCGSKSATTFCSSMPRCNPSPVR